MGETLKSLERKREALCRKLHDVGDFKRGMVSENLRKSEKGREKERPELPGIRGEKVLDELPDIAIDAPPLFQGLHA